MSNKTKKFGDPRKRSVNQSKAKNWGESLFDDAMKTKLNGDTYIFLRSTPETAKKCNHVEVNFGHNDVMIFELAKFKDHIEADNGIEIIKDDLKNWDSLIDFMENEYIQKRNCVFHSIYFKDENKLREFFTTKREKLSYTRF